MKIPIIYNLRSLRQRPVSTLTTALGMGLVVAVFIAMMALSNGFTAALSSTGSTDNVILIRQGANQELNSGISRDAARIVAGMPFVQMGADGLPMVSPETYVVVPLQRAQGRGLANVVARGVSLRALDVRQNIEMIDGRPFRSGAREVVVGKTFTARFDNSDIGDVVQFGGEDWEIVGHFTAGGSSFESEIWGENEQFMPVFRGQIFQSITFRMRDPSAFDGVKDMLEGDSRLNVDAFRELEFYASQSVVLSQVLGFIAIFISSIMAVGAVFGAVNTMYAAVASRAPEIGVLLTLGFKRRNVLMSFMAESALIALLGGIIGCLIALPINGLVTSTTNWNTFSEVAFAFRVTPRLLGTALLFSVAMGLLGGFFPAWKAARANVVDSLRQG